MFLHPKSQTEESGALNLSRNSTQLNSQIVASPFPEKDSLVDQQLDQEEDQEAQISRMSKIKEYKKKEAQRKESHPRRNQKSPLLSLNAATKKIQNVKGRSPVKRSSSRSGQPKLRASKKSSSSVPRKVVYPSAVNKSEVSIVSSVGPSSHPDANT